MAGLSAEGTTVYAFYLSWIQPTRYSGEIPEAMPEEDVFVFLQTLMV